MARALKCDRCGTFYDYIKDLRRYQIHDMNEKNYNKTIDLCPDCHIKLLKFLDLDDSDKINKNRAIVGTGELYPGEFESRHYEFEDCDNIKGERVIRCREESDGNSNS